MLVSVGWGLKEEDEQVIINNSGEKEKRQTIQFGYNYVVIRLYSIIKLR